MLWIAFKIVFLVMIHRYIHWVVRGIHVVNCFQNCIFSDDSQAYLEKVLFQGVVNCFQNCIFSDDSQEIKEINHN